MRLAVELYDTRIGFLTGDARTFDFAASAEGVARFGTNSTVLSTAIPLRPEQRRDHASRRRNWFAELLSEGDQYDSMLAQGGLRRGDTLAFLARYGRDVAGALQIWDPDDPTEPRTPELRTVDRPEIRALLEDPLGSPLGNASATGRTSLGGVQPKILLSRKDDAWAQALGGAPTTHILKPRLSGERASVIFDEEYGSRLARLLGLADFATWIEDFAGLPALVIERYDRHDGARIHQEDFNQILGAAGNQKYQEIGGVASLRRVADALTRHTSRSSLRRFARMLILAVAIGNLDMHLKNLGLLHFPDGETELAPAYDVVPQARHSGDGRFALAVNGVYRHAAVTRADLESEITAWGVRRAAQIIDDTLEELTEAALAEVPLVGSHPGLQDDIMAFIRNLHAGLPAGFRN